MIPPLRPVWLLLPLVLAAPVAGQDDPGEQAPRFFTFRRPDPADKPTRVMAGIYIFDIMKVDDVNQSFTADFGIRLMWNDRHLAGGTKEVRTFGVNEIWHPRPTVHNQRRLFLDSFFPSPSL